MNPIEQLRDYIGTTYPKAIMDVAPPLQEAGVWSLEVDMDEKRLSIEWSPETRFGLSNVSDENFGERHDETFDSLVKVQRRVDQLLTTAERTSPPFGVLLSRLRESRGLTQQELASKLGVRQASISGMECRKDIQLSTLQRTIEVLGGYLEIFGVFPDARYCIGVGWSRHARVQEVSPPLEAISSTKPLMLQEEVFVALHSASALPWASEKAESIRDRRSVLEMP